MLYVHKHSHNMFFFFYERLDGPATTSLMELQVPVLDNNECKKLFSRHKTVIDDRSLCAGYLTGGKDSCQVRKGFIIVFKS